MVQCSSVAVLQSWEKYKPIQRRVGNLDNNEQETNWGGNRKPPYAFTRMFKRIVGISPSEYKIRYESYVKADFSSFRLFNAKFLCVLDCILKDFLYICNVKTNPPLYDEYLGQLLKGNLKIPFG